jgi:hypothetical protein
MGQKCFFKVTNEGATLTQQGQNSLSWISLNKNHFKNRLFNLLNLQDLKTF